MVDEVNIYEKIVEEKIVGPPNIPPEHLETSPVFVKWFNVCENDCM